MQRNETILKCCTTKVKDIKYHTRVIEENFQASNDGGRYGRRIASEV